MLNARIRCRCLLLVKNGPALPQLKMRCKVNFWKSAGISDLKLFIYGDCERSAYSFTLWSSFIIACCAVVLQCVLVRCTVSLFGDVCSSLSWFVFAWFVFYLVLRHSVFRFLVCYMSNVVVDSSVVDFNFFIFIFGRSMGFIVFRLINAVRTHQLVTIWLFSCTVLKKFLLRSELFCAVLTKHVCCWR